MLYLFVLLFLSVIQDISATKYKCNTKDPCGCSRRPVITNRISGGENALLDTWGWSISLRNGTKHICGGSILNERFVITAAHCFPNISQLSDITVCAGTNLLSSTCRQHRVIQNIIKHSSYNSESFENDIALIEVRSPFNFNDLSIARICLPDIGHDNEYPDPGTDVVAVGWGRTETKEQPDVLQQVTIKVVDESANKCDSIAYNYHLQLCASAPGKDTCAGDSGGPLMVFTDSKRWELIGITSYGYTSHGGRCATEYPGVYTRITAFLSWIHHSTNKTSSQSTNTTSAQSVDTTSAQSVDTTSAQFTNTTSAQPTNKTSAQSWRHRCSCECPRGYQPSTVPITVNITIACVDACKAPLSISCNRPYIHVHSTSTRYSFTGNSSTTIGDVTLSSSDQNDEKSSDSISQPTATDGRKYMGGTKDGKHMGFGIFTWPNGDQYVGQFKGDKRHGNGTFNYENGEKYAGDWVDDRKTGRGVLTWPDGHQYEGEFRNDVRMGHGVFVWPNRNRYTGEFKNGKMHGNGTLNYANEEIYIGEWLDGKRVGHGVLTWPDGNRYEGQFKGDKRHGNGTLTYQTKDTYVGDWVEDKKMGRGVLTWPDGHRYEGAFQNDIRTGRGVFIWPNGNRYTGEFKNGKMHGNGTLKYTNGEIYIGGWIEGKRTGQGVLTFPDGNRYEGQFKDDKKHGIGKMIYANGRVTQGKWSKDVLRG